MGIFGRRVPVNLDDDPQVDPARPWAVLGLVNDWVRHAEAKAGATLVATAASGTVLYNLVHNFHSPPVFIDVAASIAAALVLVAGFCSAAALWPRLRARETPASLLYFDHIARAFPGPGPYKDALRRLLVDHEAELDQVAQQVWANAHVARRKYLWVGRAVAALLVGIVAVAAVAGYAALHSIGAICG